MVSARAAKEPRSSRANPIFKFMCAPPIGSKSSGHFEQTRRAHAAADEHRDDDVLHAPPLALDERMTHEARAGDTVWMSDGDGAAIDVELVVGNLQPVAAIDDLHREGFVELPQADVRHLQTSALEQARNGEDGTNAHLVGLAARHREAAEGAQRL